MGKEIGHGFDPDVCEGCPEHTVFDGDGNEMGTVERAANILTGGGGYKGCGLCGCPTKKGLILDRLQAVPEDCLRKEEHKRASQRGGAGGEGDV